ncbi:MAG: LPS export ABC transporter periplasmic protein LptC [Litorimonas sp.]
MSLQTGRSHAASDALGLWEPKRTLTLSAARKHTRRIALIQRALIGLSVALVALLVFYFATQSNEAVIEDDPETAVQMLNPRYSGRTEDNLPFYLTADTAVRQMETRNEVELFKPVLEFIRADGAESSFVEADGGLYDDVAKILDLRADPSLADELRQEVVLDTDDGINCLTTHARIFAREKRIQGDEPIRCTGDFGIVTGQTYQILDNYKTFVFENGMTGLINRDEPGELRRDAEPDAPRPMFGFGGDGPIDITADRAEYRGARIDLFGDVVVVQQDSTVYADEMQIYRDRTGSEEAGTLRMGAVRRILGTANFRYVSADNDVRGNEGLYVRDDSQMTVTGDVTVVQPGGNTVSTDRLIYDTVSETIRFSGQCQGRNCNGSGRVRIGLPGGNP